ncbi:MAG: primosomal protein N' [Deltaproteobacteria bacterium]|nr:primosomal protein N' [Deltaproteobacteria bacterium]
MTRVVSVAFPGTNQDAFSYAVPDAISAGVVIGARVAVPFRKGEKVGLVIGEAPHPDGKFELREVVEAVDHAPPFPAEIIGLLQWASRYYAVPLGELLRNACPAAIFRRSKRPPRLPSRASEDPLFPATNRSAETVTLTHAQRAAVERISAAIGAHEAFLLHGVTGSGKTEVYLRVIARLLDRGASAIVLVPEIALTPQLSARFRARFGDAVAVLHSGLADSTRTHEWRRTAGLAEPRARVVVGARSAIFAPLANLGAIIVDEEHDGSFRQEEGLPYNARDLAVVRARAASAVVVLGSATPSLESFQAASDGRFTLLELRERATAHPLPVVDWVDLRKAPRAILADLITPDLATALTDVLAREEQAILYLDRRGSSPAVVCQACGAVVHCDGCEIPFVHHRARNQLLCHTCGNVRQVPAACATCGAAELAFLGVGVEKVESALNARFPRARIIRLDRDAVRTAAALDDALGRFARHEADILVGTRMVTKGHDFPRVTLVGVLLADQGLARPDFRAAERTFQLVVQVAGRAGRADRPGRVLIQAFNIDHPALRLALTHDVKAFFAHELALRRRLTYPPFARLVIIEARGRTPDTTDTALLPFVRALSGNNFVRLIGPAPAARRRIAGAYRSHLLCKVAPDRIRGLTDRIVDTRATTPPPKGVRIFIQVDPYVVT